MNTTQSARRDLYADAEWRRQQARQRRPIATPRAQRRTARVPIYLLPIALIVRAELLLIRSAVNAGPAFWRRALLLLAVLATYAVAIDRGLIR